jgi:hypothetical protein
MVYVFKRGDANKIKIGISKKEGTHYIFLDWKKGIGAVLEIKVN